MTSYQGPNIHKFEQKRKCIQLTSFHIIIIGSLNHVASFSWMMKGIMNMWLHMGHPPFKIVHLILKSLLVTIQWFFPIQNASLVVQDVIKKIYNFIAIILVVLVLLVHQRLDKVDLGFYVLADPFAFYLLRPACLPHDEDVLVVTTWVALYYNFASPQQLTPPLEDKHGFSLEPTLVWELE